MKKIVPSLLVIGMFASVSASCVSATPTFESGNIKVHQITYDHTNSFLVTDGENSFLIDSGTNENAEKLSEAISSLGTNPSSLRALIISHGHADHAGGAQYFKENFDVPIIAGLGDEPLLASGENDELCPVGAFAKRRRPKDQALRFPATQYDQLIEVQTSLSEITGIKGTVRRLPGHTDGSLIISIDNFVFAGDLLRGGIFTRSKATTHFYMCDLDDNRTDIQFLLNDISPKASRIFTGHFGPVSPSSARKLTNGISKK